MPSIDDLIAKLSIVEDKAEKAGIAIDRLTAKSAIQSLQSGRSAIYSGNMTSAGFTFNPGGGDFNKVQAQFSKASVLINTMMKQLDGFVSISRGVELSDAKQIQRNLIEVATVVNSITAAAEVAKRLNAVASRGPTTGTSLLIDPKELMGRTLASQASTAGSVSELIRGKTAITPRGGLDIKDLVSVFTHEFAHALEESVDILAKGDINEKLISSKGLVRQRALERLDTAGYSTEDMQDMEFRQRFAGYYSDPREVFAREFSNFSETGKTEIPELQNTFQKLFSSFDEQTLDTINQLKVEATKARDDIRRIFEPIEHFASRSDVPLPRMEKGVFTPYIGLEPKKERGDEMSELQTRKEELFSKIRANINKVADDYVESTKNVPAQESRIIGRDISEAVRERVKETLRGAATGGTPTETRLDEVTDQYLTNKLDEISRVRTGGGSRVNLNKIRDELDGLISQVVTEKWEEVKAVLAGGGGAKKPPTGGGIAVSADFPPGGKPGEQKVPFGAQAVDPAKKLEENLQKISTSLREIGLTSEMLWDIMSADIIQSGVEIDKVFSKLGKLKNGYQEVVTTVKAPTGGTRTFNTFISEDFTGITKEIPKKVLPSLEEQYEDIAGRLGRGFVAKLQGEIAQSQQVFSDLGIERTFNRIDVGIPVKLADGLARVNTVIYNGMVGLEKYTLFLDQAKNAMTALEKEAYLAAQQQYTEPGLVASLGEVRTKKALQLAGKHGFGVEQLQQAYTQEPTGVSFLKFSAKDAEGVTQKLEVTIDRVGNVLTRTNKKLLGFTDAIIKNTQEVLRWSVGVGLVYGTMYKLQELLRVAIDNEAKLVDIAIALGDAQRDLNVIFDEAAKVASETGESINDVLETYSLAYRAVGAIEDPVQKSAAAIQLLTDATVLNKLSSLDSATSIDVLAGALRQLQKPGEDTADAFERGRELLDSWVQVSRKANVDLATLATAFSITAESAENSGVSIAELNAIIASMAEKIGGLGGRETGNAIRALIGGVYQQQAAEALAQYGIASQDTAGRMRPFLEISREIFELYDAGIISSDELNKIGYTLGGGVRRGQQYVAFLSDFERIQQLVNEQVGAGGSAQEALGRKVDTVQTSITNLNNAFQNLAQTLGTSGGVLDTASGLLRIFTQLLNLTEGITQALGNIAIPAAVLGIMTMMFRGETGALRRGLFTSNVQSRVAGGVESSLGVLGLQQNIAGRGYGPRGGTYTQANVTGVRVGSFVAQNALGIIAGIYPAIQRAMSDELTKPEKAAAVGANIGGAIIGTVLASGNPIGGVIGSAIADTFIGATLAYQEEFNNLFANAFVAGAKDAEDEISDLRKLQQGVTKDILKAAGGGSAFEGLLRGRLTAAIFNASQLLTEGQFGGMTAEQGALTYATRAGTAEGLVPRIQEARYRTPLEIGEAQRETSAIQQRRIELTKQEADLLNKMAKSVKERLVVESATGKIKPKQFADLSLVAGGFEETIPKLYEAYGEQFDLANDSVKGLEETFKSFSEILQYSSAEDRNTLIQLTNELFDLYTGLELLESGARESFLFKGDPVNTEEAKKQIEEITERVVGLSNLLDREQAKAKFVLPEIVGLQDIKSVGAIEQVVKDARKLQDEAIEIGLVAGNFDERTVQLMIEDAAPIFINGGDKIGYYIAQGIIDSKYITEAFKNREDEFSNIDIGFEEFDVPRDTLNKVIAQSGVLAQQFEKYGYKTNLEDLITITSEGNVELNKADWKIVQYLLQQILETEKKQLDGIYNLPSGAGFYVPYQTLDLAYQKGLNESSGDISKLEDVLSKLTFGPAPEDTYGGEGTGAVTSVDEMKRTNKHYEDLLAREKQTEAVYEQADRYLPSRVPRGAGGRREIEGDAPGFIEGILRKLLPNLFELLDRTAPTRDESTSFSKPPTTTTALNMNINSTTTLLVDGRALAEVVKQYLHEDMIRYEGTTTLSRTVAI